MEILKQDIWLVRIAYMFTKHQNMPESVDRCTLWKRFGLMLTPWLLTNLIGWLVFGVVLGLIARPVLRLILFVFAGKKLVHNYTSIENYTGPYVGVRVLDHLTVLAYKWENIKWLDWVDLDGFRCPIAYLVGVVAMILIAVGLIYAAATSISDIGSFFVYYTYTAGEYVYDTSGWWGSGVLILTAAALLVYSCKKGYKKFAATESGGVVISHLKSWKEKHCTVYKLV